MPLRSVAAAAVGRARSAAGRLSWRCLAKWRSASGPCWRASRFIWDCCIRRAPCCCWRRPSFIFTSWQGKSSPQHATPLKEHPLRRQRTVMPARNIRIGVIGASGYTGADLVRIAARHPAIDIGVLTANTHAGKAAHDVFPHFSSLELPPLIKNEDADWSKIDVVFCGLPHATSQEVIKALPRHLKIIDMSADFRLRDAAVYEKWYGTPHRALDLQNEAVYGLTEHYRDEIRKGRLIACPGCYQTAVLLMLLPLVK